jgi:hypothetical protein
LQPTWVEQSHKQTTEQVSWIRSAETGQSGLCSLIGMLRLVRSGPVSTRVSSTCSLPTQECSNWLRWGCGASLPGCTAATREVSLMHLPWFSYACQPMPYANQRIRRWGSRRPPVLGPRVQNCLERLITTSHLPVAALLISVASMQRRSVSVPHQQPDPLFRLLPSAQGASSKVTNKHMRHKRAQKTVKPCMVLAHVH